MKALKRVVMATVVALACAGVYGALRNLPVASGCAFYGDCPATVDVDLGSDAQPSANPPGAALRARSP